MHVIHCCSDFLFVTGFHVGLYVSWILSDTEKGTSKYMYMNTNSREHV